MNKHFLLSIICMLFINNLLAQVLPLTQVTQEQNQWCWAGSSKCILDYYNHTVRQCDIAEYTRTVATWHNFGTQSCCDNPSGSCNYWNYNWGYNGSIQDILQHFASIQNSGRSAALTCDEVQTEISNLRPFVIRWGWTTGGGHFIVGHGIQNGTLYYMDPWYGEGLKFATFNWVLSNTEHTWTHTNVISANPSVLLVSENSLMIAPPANSTNTFIITSNTNWTITGNQSWLTVSNGSGSGNTTVTLTAEENSTAVNRTATVRVSGSGAPIQIITITQMGTGTDYLIVPSRILSMTSESNSNALFNISSNMSWTISSNQSWLTASSTNGTGNASITLTATANPAIVDRTATIFVASNGVASQTITVTQKSAAPELMISTNSLSIAQLASSTNTLDITSNISWTVTCDRPWLKTSDVSGSGNKTITLTALSTNSTTAKRTATVTISGIGVTTQIVNITQSGNTTGIDELNNDQNVTVYPNPCRGKFTLGLRNFNEENTTIKITNSLGIIVKEMVIDNFPNIYNQEVDLSGRAEGIYYITIQTSKTKLIKTVVIQ